MSALDTAKEIIQLAKTSGLSDEAIDQLDKKSKLLTEQLSALEVENIQVRGEAKKDAIERFRIVFQYLSYENTTYWTRGQLFLVANTTLFGFEASILQRDQGFNLLTVAIAFGGLVLTFFWVQGIRAGEFWIAHWHAVLKGQLEKPAFDQVLLLRDFKPTAEYPPRVRARPVAYGPVILFAVLWIVALVSALRQIEDIGAHLQPGFIVESTRTKHEIPAVLDRYSEIERLKKLLDQGALSQEEFNREKARLLM